MWPEIKVEKTKGSLYANVNIDNKPYYDELPKQLCKKAEILPQFYYSKENEWTALIYLFSAIGQCFVFFIYVFSNV